MFKPGWRPVAVLLAAGALGVMPATASAEGELNTLAQQLYHVQGLTYSYQGTAAQVFAFVFSKRAAEENRQLVTGTFGGSPFAGFLYEHSYDRTNDIGHYRLAGTVVPPSGFPVPVLAGVDAKIDRTQDTYVLSLQGTFAGVPFSGQTDPIVNPFYHGI